MKIIRIKINDQFDNCIVNTVENCYTTDESKSADKLIKLMVEFSKKNRYCHLNHITIAFLMLEEILRP